MMFGSDWPVCQVAATYSQTHEIVSKFSSKLSQSEKEALFGETAIQFYNLQ